MQATPLVVIAMGLDALPVIGRVMALALLMSCALYGFFKVLQGDSGGTLKLLYCKGALAALLVVPILVYLFEIRVPVPVEELVLIDNPWPGYVTTALLMVWVCGCCYHLWRFALDLHSTRQVPAEIPLAGAVLMERARHWQNRLNLKAAVSVHAGGAEQAWHTGTWLPGQPARLVLPAAAANWPTGLQDVMLLGQLGQLQQGGWRWLAFGRLVQALYWPMPWVGWLVQHFAEQFELPGQRLAAAGYRDREGWQRDARNLQKRAATLRAVPSPVAGGILRLPNGGEVWLPPPNPRPHAAGQEELSVAGFEHVWAHSKARKRDKERDPYEQAYWLIAIVCILTGVATTLTQVPAAPEFEPQYLNIKWQDQMLPRMRDYTEDVPAQEDDQVSE